MKPGEIIAKKGEIDLNKESKKTKLKVYLFLEVLVSF